MHISKSNFPSLNKKDIILLNDVILEIIDYSNELFKNFILEAKKILDIGLVISDFFLIIFWEIAEKGNNTNNSKLSDILRYPLSLKLLLLKANFKVLNNYENDYKNAEKNLNEIIEIQLYLKTSGCRFFSSKFHMAKIKYFFKNYKEAQKFALDAKNLFENYNNKKDDYNLNEAQNKKEEEIIEKKISQNVSNILSFLAQIFLNKNEYIKCGYMLWKWLLFKFRETCRKNQITEYFKNKLELINEELKECPIFPQKKAQVVINSNTPNKNININKKTQNINIGNIIHKGKAEAFCFKIPTSSLYEPFLLSLYSLS